MTNVRSDNLGVQAPAERKPFFSRGNVLRTEERDEAVLSGKLPPDAAELRPAEYGLSSWIRLSGL